MRAALLLVITLLPVVLAGCTDRAPAAEIAPANVRLNGVNATPAGDLLLVPGDGIVIAPADAAVVISADPLVRGSLVHACAADCVEATVPRGAVLAEGGLMSLRNASLNAGGPDGDSAVFFFDEGQETGRWLRWSDAMSSFHANAPFLVDGNVVAAGSIGSRTPVVVNDEEGNPQVLVYQTIALEGGEPAIFTRGSASLENGTALVRLPPIFFLLAEPVGITAQVTLTSRGPPLFVSAKTPTHIVVESVTGANETATFDYFVQAVRKTTVA